MTRMPDEASTISEPAVSSKMNWDESRKYALDNLCLSR